MPKLPLYLIAGEQPVSLEKTVEGGMRLLGWDFEKKQMTWQAASWDDVIGFEWDGASEQPIGDVREVTKKEFDAVIRRLRRA